MNLRAATRADIPTIIAFIRELAAFEKLSHEVVATEETLAQTLFAAPIRAAVVIAELEGAPVGFALYFYSYSTFLAKAGIYLEDLYVRKSHRGNGIGRALLRHLAQQAESEGCGRLEWRVLNWNASAIRFYESLGAEAQSEWTTYRMSL
jgi:GNAT superfamily N-acetyltransferase